MEPLTKYIKYIIINQNSGMHIIIFSLLILISSSTWASNDVFGIITETSEELITNSAKILAINKVTTKHKTIEIKQDESIYFGNITITLHKCNKIQNQYSSDNQIYLSVYEHSVNNDPEKIFQGWIISSSPSLSTIVHPIYQLLAIECFDA